MKLRCSDAKGTTKFIYFDDANILGSRLDYLFTFLHRCFPSLHLFLI